MRHFTIPCSALNLSHPFRNDAMRKIVFVALLASLLDPIRSPAAAQDRARVGGSLVIVMGAEAVSPVPTLINYSQANQDVADQLFLRLVRPGPGLQTAGDTGFIPELARKWTRRDSLTVEFELDPRARWHDGTPVTARDVVFTINRTLEPDVDPQRATLLRYLKAVAAEGDRRVRFRFSRYYPEQIYDASFHVQPLPAHLVEGISAKDFPTSDFISGPVGNGPYRWVRREPGQLVELRANETFFLGRPKIARVVFRTATDAQARINMLLTGEADATETVFPLTTLERVRSNTDLQLVPFKSLAFGYLLFNQTDYPDRGRPHPILGDPAVRRAFAMAVDRKTVNRALFGSYAALPPGPVSQALWLWDPSIRGVRFDSAGARKLLAARGWIDRDGDGVLDKAGRPLVLKINVPTSSQVRTPIALQVQQQLRRIGVKLELIEVDIAVLGERRRSGNFDIEFSSVTQDPSPSGLMQSWSCVGGTNVGKWCNRQVDSLFEQAIFARSNPRPIWRRAIETLNDDAPAVFIYALTQVAAVHRRFENAAIRPESHWIDIRHWSVAPGRELPRDRASAQ